MRTLILPAVLMLFAGVAMAVPPQLLVSIKLIEGVIVDLPSLHPQICDTVKIRVTSTTAPEVTKNLYSLFRKKTAYRVQDLQRPKKDEAILVLPLKSIPKTAKVGDKLRIKEYGVPGSEEAGARSFPLPYVAAVELNPKG